MAIALGIDTGGTYTDAVLVDLDDGSVILGAKSLTTRRDLSIGIGKAIDELLVDGPLRPSEVEVVALSTTLATNAIVEGQGTSACLLLIGYDPLLIQQYGFEQDLATRDIVYISGGHDVMGDQVEALDLDTAREAIQARLGKVEAFAVSSYFGIRNPEHELEIRRLIEELSAAAGNSGRPVPVTCGHELTSRLNSVRRATTAVLNARLIPLLQELIATVRCTLDARSISAPLMVVKGDGSLVRAEWALGRPIETILSGPAASVIGAWHLAGRRDVWVADVGGTTTDIAALRNGRPYLNPKGARVGRWQTMVEAVDVHTVGLGGDSQVSVTDNQTLSLGPRRVIPLCLLASEYPGIVSYLEAQVARPPDPQEAGMFVLNDRRPRRMLEDEEQRFLNLLQGDPQPLHLLVERWGRARLALRLVERLERERLLLRAGFTPTDALHCLGRFQRWNTEASRLGAKLWAARMRMPTQDFCEKVVSSLSDRASKELVSKVLSDEASAPNWDREPTAATLLERALEPNAHSELQCRLTLKQPLVAIGAPAAAYFPRVSQQLHAEVIIPPHADIANAVGAVVGGIVLRQAISIQPIHEETRYRVFLPTGVQDLETLDQAVQCAREAVSSRLEAQARQAGADQVEIQVSREDRRAPVAGGWGREIFLETILLFTAVGRPGLGSHSPGVEGLTRSG